LIPKLLPQTGNATKRAAILASSYELVWRYLSNDSETGKSFVFKIDGSLVQTMRQNSFRIDEPR
jgi:hypothetical protein